MPVYRVFQKVTHPKLTKAYIKEHKVIGRDLRHAVEMLRIPAPMKKDLEKKYWTRTVDPHGRELYLEVIEDMTE